MELKPGYKQTEVGVIPEDWRICQLRQVCTVLRGGSPRPIEDYLTENADGINWIKIGDVGAGAKYIDSTAERILPSGMSRSRYVKPGDFLLSNSMSFGRPYILRIDGCIHDGWLVIGSYQATFSSEYLYYCLSSDGVLAQYLRYAAGSSVLNLNKDIVSRVYAAIPGLQEQAKISKVLGEVDQLVEQLEGLIHKKKNIKQAAMQELLTGKRRLPGFEGEWEMKKLGDEIRDLEAGVSVRSTTDKDQPSTGCYILKTSAVSHGQFSPTERKEIISCDIRRAKTPIMAGDLIISRMNTPALVGECGYSHSDHPNIFLPDRLWRASYRDPQAVSSRWLTYALSTQQNRTRIKELATGTSGSMKNISKSALLDLEIKWPSLAEQNAIADVLSEMDYNIDAINAQLQKAQGVKQGMMQQLLTGKIRLT